MYYDGDDTESHNERLDPGKTPLSPGVCDLSQKEPSIPHDGDNLIPEWKQTGSHSCVGGHLVLYCLMEGKIFY